MACLVGNSLQEDVDELAWKKVSLQLACFLTETLQASKAKILFFPKTDQLNSKTFTADSSMDDVVKAGFDKVPTAQLCWQWQLAANCAQSTVSPNNVLCPRLGRHSAPGQDGGRGNEAEGDGHELFWSWPTRNCEKKKLWLGFIGRRIHFLPNRMKTIAKVWWIWFFSRPSFWREIYSKQYHYCLSFSGVVPIFSYHKHALANLKVGMAIGKFADRLIRDVGASADDFTLVGFAMGRLIYVVFP